MRKTFTILFSCLCALYARAQNDFAQNWDAMFKHIAVSGSLNTGFFAKQGLADSSLLNFTGSANDSWAYNSNWSNAYQFAELAAISPLQVKPYDTVIAQLRKLQGMGKLPVSLLALQYGDFASNAISNGSIVFDSVAQTFHVADLPTAFEKKDLFICLPSLPTVFQTELPLFLDSNCFLNTLGSGIKSIEFMIGQQQFVQIPMNQDYMIQLNEGANPIVFRVTFLNGKVKVSRSNITCDLTDYLLGNDIHKRIGDPMHIGDALGNIFAEPARPTELSDFLSASVKCLPGYTANGDLHTCPQKPLIIVEGIDFGFKDHWTDYYGEKYGNFGLVDLMNGCIFNPYAEKESERRIQWKPIEKAPLFLDSLRRQGFDVYYIDFHNGAEYMENNALLVEELIRQLNILKCSDEELVVIGCSMGGVIAKYALADMEHKQLKHCVRTYVSFDAPHQGANIPFGLQAFLEFYKGKLPVVKEHLKRKINRAATRQLLIQHIDADHLSGPHQDRKDWLALSNQLGYPKICRNIAITNGSVDGSAQNFNQGDELLILNPINAQLDKVPVRWTSSVFAMSHMMAGTLFKDPKQIVLHTKMGPLTFIKEVDPTIYADHIPGSIRYDLLDHRAIYGIINLVNLHSATCFIPSYSALDLSYEQRDSISQVYVHGNNKHSQAFDAMFGVKNTNEEHMEITDKNMYWLFNELLKNEDELPYAIKTYYNYGFAERTNLPSMSIQELGHVQINGNQLTRYAHAAYRQKPELGSLFSMQTAQCNDMVMIEKGGILELGDHNLEMNKANLTIKSQAVLWIRKGGQLIINNGSKLIIEPGAKLIYDEGAIITLKGNDAVLCIKGQLELQENAQFKIDKGSADMTGYVLFSNPDQVPQNASVIAAGKNAEIHLTGKDASSDVLMEMDGLVQFGSAQFPLANVEINTAKVVYNSKTQLTVFGNVALQNTQFEMLSNGLFEQSNAIVVQMADSVIVKDTRFTGFEKAVNYFGTLKEKNRLNILRSQFKNCSTAVEAQSVTCMAQSMVLSQCETGLRLNQLESDAQLQNCQISNCKTGVVVSEREQSGIVLQVQTCDFVKNQLGLALNQCHTAIACSRFVANGVGVEDAFGTMTLSESYGLQGLKGLYYGGNNTFAYQQQYAIQLQATWFYLNQGKNNFMATATAQAPYNFIVGDVAYSAETHNTSSPYALKAADNFWQNYSSSNIANGVYQWYLIKFPHPLAGALTLNELNGAVLGALNTTCLNVQNNGGLCEKVMQQMDSLERARDIKPLQSVLMPQPAAKEVTVQITQSIADWHMIKLIGMQGQIIKEQMLRQGQLSWSLEDVADGMYFISISNGFETIAKPLIVKHL